MAGESLIGNLAVLLTMDTAAFEKGANQAQRLLSRTQREFDKVGKDFQRVGRNMSTYLTVPILAVGAGAIKMAADFETSMNQVAISTQGSADEMQAMKNLALEIGTATTKSASEAAQAMDLLAKTGLSTRDILNGGAKAAVALAEAAGSELDPAAAAITDTMQQFHKSVEDLPNIINNITGAVNQSKFDFADFQLGMAQAGGVAASAGVEFEDFTAALAATASQFASGSDAGTSFKTFMMRLTPETKKQAAAFKEYGLAFHNANGELKSMAEIAQILQDKFAGLSEQDRTAIFKQLFGTDAIRTAIGLMQQGAAGIEAMQEKIAATDASAQAAMRMKGLNAELEKLKGALEKLAIKIGDSGLLSAVTALVTGFAGLIGAMAELSPTTVKVVGGLAALLAAMGPLWLVFGTGIRAIGLLIPLLIKLRVVGLAAGPAMTALGVALRFMLGPIGLAITAVGAVYFAFKNWDKIKPIVQNMVHGVANTIRGNLYRELDDLKRRVNSVADTFRSMYDRVVGHSYVPDMVDGIQQHFARLDDVMVKPAKNAAKAAAEAFQQLKTDTSNLLDSLFPAEVAMRERIDNLNLLAKAAQKGVISMERLAQAQNEVRGLNTPADVDIQFDTPLGELGNAGTGSLTAGFEAVNDTLDKIKQRAEDMRRVVKEVAKDLAQMAGEWLSDWISGTAKLKDLLKGLLAYAIRFATSETGLATFFGGARAMGGPVVGGRAYLVGERGPELFMPGASGQVIPNHALAMAGDRGAEVHFHGITDFGGFNRNRTQIARQTRRDLGF